MGELSQLTRLAGLPQISVLIWAPTMDKNCAIQLLGGTVTAAAQALEMTPSGVSQWPARLPRRLSDRVLGAWARKQFPEAVRAAVEVESRPELSANS
jgi:hypothetical protein